MENQYQQLLATHVNYVESIRQAIQNYRYVVFYGCGIIYDSIVDTWMEYVQRPIDYCCDSNPEKWGKSFRGVPCISPQELEKIKDQVAIFVTVGQFKPVFEQLRSQGFPSVNLLFKYDLITSDFIEQQDKSFVQARLQETFDHWADERSKQVFNTIIARAIGGNRNIDLMPSICDPKQYFPPEIVSLSQEENYVDVGAYDGDTVGYFLKAAQGRFNAIHAFELDAVNYEKLTGNIDLQPHKERIHTYNIGAWNEKATLTFKTGETSSSLGQGDAIAQVAPLDEILASQPVSFIKMDIEGAEPQALQGAQGIIRAQHPKLAICVYHHISHLWDIPAYIRQLFPDYQLYLRHHNNLEYETVCYAIPSI